MVWPCYRRACNCCDMPNTTPLQCTPYFFPAFRCQVHAYNLFPGDPLGKSKSKSKKVLSKAWGHGKWANREERGGEEKRNEELPSLLKTTTLRAHFEAPWLYEHSFKWPSRHLQACLHAFYYDIWFDNKHAFIGSKTLIAMEAKIHENQFFWKAC